MEYDVIYGEVQQSRIWAWNRQASFETSHLGCAACSMHRWWTLTLKVWFPLWKYYKHVVMDRSQHVVMFCSLPEHVEQWVCRVVHGYSQWNNTNPHGAKHVLRCGFCEASSQIEIELFQRYTLGPLGPLGPLGNAVSDILWVSSLPRASPQVSTAGLTTHAHRLTLKILSTACKCRQSLELSQGGPQPYGYNACNGKNAYNGPMLPKISRKFKSWSVIRGHLTTLRKRTRKDQPKTHQKRMSMTRVPLPSP